MTTQQIVTLRDEAASAGDIVTRILCDMAIDGRDSRDDLECHDADGYPDYSGGGHAGYEMDGIRKALRMSQDEAREAVADLLAEARDEAGR